MRQPSAFKRDRRTLVLLAVRIAGSISLLMFLVGMLAGIASGIESGNVGVGLGSSVVCLAPGVILLTATLLIYYFFEYRQHHIKRM